MTDGSPTPELPSRGRGRPSTLDRTAVLDATWRVIAARGVNGTRYVDVAEESNTPASTLQNAFGTLQSLLAEAVTHASERDDAFLTMIPTADEATAHERLEALTVGAVGPRFRPDAFLVWLELWRASVQDSALAERSRTSYDGWWAVAESIVGQGQQEGVFTTDATARELAVTVIAILDGVALSLLLPSNGADADRASQLALAGVRRLLAA